METKSLLTKIQSNTLFIWSIPILGSYMAVCMDIGALSYYDIPREYAEINLRTIVNSVVWLGVSVALLSMFLNMIYQKSSEDDLVARVFQNVHISFIPMLLWITLYFIKYDLRLTIVYIFFALIRIVVSPYFDKKSSLTYKERVAEILDKDAEIEGTGNTKTKADFGYRITYWIFGFLVVSSLISQFGYHAEESTKTLTVKDRLSTIAIKRNNDFYILKKYDPQTYVLDHDFEIIKSDSGNLKLEEIALNKVLMTRIDAVEAEKSKLEKIRVSAAVNRSLSDTSKNFHYFLDFIYNLTK
jgi:hypothetical protein